jgi:hypothetical protein
LLAFSNSLLLEHFGCLLIGRRAEKACSPESRRSGDPGYEEGNIPKPLKRAAADLVAGILLPPAVRVILVDPKPQPSQLIFFTKSRMSFTACV